jgi:hypothetical protein
MVVAILSVGHGQCKVCAPTNETGIDFIEALRLWQDVLRIEVPARTLDEPRCW